MENIWLALILPSPADGHAIAKATVTISNPQQLLLKIVLLSLGLSVYKVKNIGYLQPHLKNFKQFSFLCDLLSNMTHSV